MKALAKRWATLVAAGPAGTTTTAVAAVAAEPSDVAPGATATELVSAALFGAVSPAALGPLALVAPLKSGVAPWSAGAGWLGAARGADLTAGAETSLAGAVGPPPLPPAQRRP